MQVINISVVQTKLFWESVDENLSHFTNLISTIEGCDLIILPEMFTTGFSMLPELYAEESTTKGIEWMKSMAITKQSALCGSLMYKDTSNCFYNTFVFVTPNQDISFYHKRHLFSPGAESEHYTRGKEKVLIDFKGWKICPQICYDLRFPVFSRNTEGYDLLIYVANWPEKRNYAWQTLLKARAIENQCYVVACNRLGEDGNGVNHIGNSCIINYMGEEIGFENKDKVYQFNLNKASLLQYRQDFPILNDRDFFEIKI
jgi:omega-amidase